MKTGSPIPAWYLNQQAELDTNVPPTGIQLQIAFSVPKTNVNRMGLDFQNNGASEAETPLFQREGQGNKDEEKLTTVTDTYELVSESLQEGNEIQTTGVTVDPWFFVPGKKVLPIRFTISSQLCYRLFKHDELLFNNDCNMSSLFPTLKPDCQETRSQETCCQEVQVHVFAY